jgi:hypothetical protein
MWRSPTIPEDGLTDPAGRFGEHRPRTSSIRQLFSRERHILKFDVPESRHHAVHRGERGPGRGPDRSPTPVFFGPTAPEGKESNWLPTVPGKGWFTILRRHNQMPSFFDKSWRPRKIERV